jgi:hypothetical protein
MSLRYLLSVQSGFYWPVDRNWAENKGKQGREQRISGEMGWAFQLVSVGQGLIDCGSIDVDSKR